MKKNKLEPRHIDLKQIKDPSFLKDLSYKEMDVLSDDIRSLIIKETSINGGHLSANLGVVEATIALCRTFDFNKDKIIFDVGHQSYTYKVLTGRSLENLRKSNGVSGFQKRSESSFDHYEAGHSSTSISAASGMALARDLNKDDYHVVAFIGDSSIVNGLSFEGLNSAAKDHKIIIVLNDNEMSISKPVGRLSDSFRKFSNSNFYSHQKHNMRKVLDHILGGKFILNKLIALKGWLKRHLIKMTIFDVMGYDFIGPIDGHDIKELTNAFKKAKRADRSIVVHIRTKKGKGYAPSENDKSGSWHGLNGFNIETGEVNKVNGTSWSKYYSELLLEEMRANEDIVSLCPATEVGSCINCLNEEFPERFIDVGISEEHAVVMASGLAVSKKHPVISMYSTFLQRAYDEISHDAARMKLPMTFLVDRSGLVGSDGETHQGIYDEAMLYSVPNTIVAMASNTTEAKHLFKESINASLPYFIRYPKDMIYEGEDESLKFGKWIKVIDGSKEEALITYGPMINEVKKLIESNNKSLTLINAFYQNPMDKEMIASLKDYKKVIICDFYGVSSGFSTQLVKELSLSSFKGEIVVKSIPDEFIDKGSIKEQLERCHLSMNDILKVI